MYSNPPRTSADVKPNTRISTHRAVTLVELLLVIAVLGVLLALTTVGLAATRKAARGVRKLSDTRQIGVAVQAYSHASNDLPPVLFSKPLAWPENEQTVTVAGAHVAGTWFGNGRSFYLLIDPYLPIEMLRGGSQSPSILKTNAGNTVDWTPYQLTDTLYAGVDYWVPARQRPLSAWGAQGLDGVAAPSQKGMIVHPHYVDFSAIGENSDLPIEAHAGGNGNGPESVCWFDLSASVPKERELKPGIANRYRWGVNPGSLNEYDPGPTILNTYLGLSGMDR